MHAMEAAYKILSLLQKFFAIFNSIESLVPFAWFEDFSYKTIDLALILKYTSSKSVEFEYIFRNHLMIVILSRLILITVS